jgi:hypothetical protein
MIAALTWWALIAVGVTLWWISEHRASKRYWAAMIRNDRIYGPGWEEPS